jgi:hypothetical protein
MRLPVSTSPANKASETSKAFRPTSAPLPAINAPVKEILPALKSLAAAGNANAACRLAFELRRCSPELQDGFRRFAARLFEESEKPFTSPERRQRIIGEAETAMAGFHKVVALCEGVPKDETTEAWRYLFQAALAGHGPSMARAASAPPSGPPFEVLDGMLAYREHAPALLERALDMGYPEAYEQGRLSYMIGSLWGLRVAIDRPRALGYAIALGRVSTPQEVERLEGIIAAAKKDLSPEENSRALQLANGYTEKVLLRVRPGSVDYTRGTYTKDDGSHCE